LPAASQDGRRDAELNDFTENGGYGVIYTSRPYGDLDLDAGRFRDVLHEAIRTGLNDGVDDVQINGAIQTHQGWMHIHGVAIQSTGVSLVDTFISYHVKDGRNVPALGRIGDPDDILASVLVQDGKVP
jgi:hypothetical protein